MKFKFRQQDLIVYNLKFKLKCLDVTLNWRQKYREIIKIIPKMTIFIFYKFLLVTTGKHRKFELLEKLSSFICMSTVCS